MPRPRRADRIKPRPFTAALGRVALLPLLAGGLLAACGGSGSPSATDAAAREQATEQQAEAKFQDFARCLREHGVDAEAISHPGGGHGLKVGPGSSGASGMEAAERACVRYRPEEQRGNPSPSRRWNSKNRCRSSPSACANTGSEWKRAPPAPSASRSTGGPAAARRTLRAPPSSRRRAPARSSCPVGDREDPAPPRSMELDPARPEAERCRRPFHEAPRPL